MRTHKLKNIIAPDLSKTPLPHSLSFMCGPNVFLSKNSGKDKPYYNIDTTYLLIWYRSPVEESLAFLMGMAEEAEITVHGQAPWSLRSAGHPETGGNCVISITLAVMPTSTTAAKVPGREPCRARWRRRGGWERLKPRPREGASSYCRACDNQFAFFGLFLVIIFSFTYIYIFYMVVK